MRRFVLLLTWTAGLAATALALVLCGRGTLAGPDLAHPSTWSTWAGGRDPLDAGVAVVRTGLLVATSYLLVLTLLGVFARLASLPRVVARLDVAGGPLVRAVLGTTLVVSTLAPAAAVATETPSSTAEMRVLDAPSTTTTTPPPATPTVPTPVAAPPSAATPAAPTTYVVVPGDSFWRIARNHLATSLGRPPTTAEVARYWRVLVAANEARLLVRSAPDLIRPGQRFVLP